MLKPSEILHWIVTAVIVITLILIARHNEKVNLTQDSLIGRIDKEIMVNSAAIAERDSEIDTEFAEVNARVDDVEEGLDENAAWITDNKNAIDAGISDLKDLIRNHKHGLAATDKDGKRTIIDNAILSIDQAEKLEAKYGSNQRKK